MYQDTTGLKKLIDSQLKRNPNVSLKRLFKLIRANEKTSLIGDLVLMTQTIRRLSTLKIKLSKKQLTHALNESPEFKSMGKAEKSSIIFFLEDIQKHAK